MEDLSSLAERFNMSEDELTDRLIEEGFLKKDGSPRKSTINYGYMRENGLIYVEGVNEIKNILGIYEDSDDSDEYEEDSDDDEDSDEYEEDSDDDEDSDEYGEDSEEYEDSDEYEEDSDDDDDYEEDSVEDEDYSDEGDDSKYDKIEKKESVYNKLKKIKFWNVLKGKFKSDDEEGFENVDDSDDDDTVDECSSDCVDNSDDEYSSDSLDVSDDESYSDEEDDSYGKYGSENEYDDDDDCYEEPDYDAIALAEQKKYETLSEEEKKEFIYNKLKSGDFFYLLKIAYNFDDSVEFYDEEEHEYYDNPLYYMSDYISEVAEKVLLDLYHDDFVMLQKYFGPRFEDFLYQYEEDKEVMELVALYYLDETSKMPPELIEFFEKFIQYDNWIWESYKKGKKGLYYEKKEDYFGHSSDKDSPDYDGPDSDWFPNGPNDADDFLWEDK